MQKLKFWEITDVYSGQPNKSSFWFCLFVFFFLSSKQGSFLYTLDIYHNDVDICVVSVL